MRRATGLRSTRRMQPYYQDVYDHVLRVNDTIEGLRDLITSIYETRLALNDHSLNTVTRQLAAWAAIIAVPTAVTGFYGQNIPYPGFAAAQRLLDEHRHLGRCLRHCSTSCSSAAAGSEAGGPQKVGRSGKPEVPPLPSFTPSTWCSWMLLMSKPTRDAAMYSCQTRARRSPTSRTASSQFVSRLRSPVAQRHRVVLAQVLLVARLEPVVLHRRR